MRVQLMIWIDVQREPCAWPSHQINYQHFDMLDSRFPWLIEETRQNGVGDSEVGETDHQCSSLLAQLSIDTWQ